MENGLNEIIEVDPLLIKVAEDLPRVRKDMANIDKLAESLRTKGQIQPILINQDYELIAGGRRLAACLYAGIKVKCCFKETSDKLLIRELEIEENLQRENFTPAEEILAIEELHKIRVGRFGEATPGRPAIGEKKTGWSLEDTAELMGKTEGNVREALKLAETIRNFPELKDAPTKTVIAKAAKGVEKLNKRIEGLEKYKEITKEIDIPVMVTQDDARKFMKDLPDKSIDLLLTDPIYGIDIDEIALGSGGETGGNLPEIGFKYEDKREEAFDLYTHLARESFRFCKDDAHAWVFLGPENFWDIKKIFEKEGWLVNVKPFIWIKGMSGQGNQPSMWPTSAYEMCMFARKRASRLVLEGKVDWINIPRIAPSEKRHGAEKPLALAKELILRTTLPGMVMADPFMGSGAFVEAGVEAKLSVFACDIAYESYITTVERIGQWKERHPSK